ncbi:hypothetical protein NITGR_700005 [Nitrospina gracilis 3/211]|uniref:Uncharacterized protein n=1 Tax=Nitrospina gracilis (strain 3/211) TaxID=1266370 RepID=M1ZDC0_NITG3|nr:hypothetical protein [Nitrospina sp. Nb-3]CCQ91444.1 hypothetical protein NITGR_700005 [Nitrospina gracilis 3/211]
MASYGDLLILIGAIIVGLRIAFYQFLKSRYPEVWQVHKPVLGFIDSSVIDSKSNESIRGGKYYKKLNDSTISRIGDLTNLLTVVFLWLFGLFLIWVFIFPLIKIIH